jgi:hypothetical protein
MAIDCGMASGRCEARRVRIPPLKRVITARRPRRVPDSMGRYVVPSPASVAQPLGRLRCGGTNCMVQLGDFAPNCLRFHALARPSLHIEAQTVGHWPVRPAGCRATGPLADLDGTPSHTIGPPPFLRYWTTLQAVP